MSAPRRPTSRRATSRPAPAVPAGAAAGTVDPVDADFAEPIGPVEAPARDAGMSAAAIRAARAEERRARPEEPVQRSVLAERAGRFGGLYGDTRAELKKITWPDRETTRNLTVVVIGISIVLGIVLGGIDYVLFQIFEALP